jgi:parallel beta-helix repeat protein
MAAIAALLVVSGACSGSGESVPEVTLPEITLGPPTTAVPVPTDTITSSTDAPGGIAAEVVNPGDDLSALVDAAAAGTAFLLAPGTHRLHSVTPKDGMSFTGSPGAVMSGAMVLEGFRQEDSFWQLSGPEMTGATHGNCITDYSGCALSQDLFMDDVMLWQVTAIEDLEEGRWFWDGDNIYVANDPSSRRVELSVAAHAFVGAADDVTIADLRIEKYATPAQQGTVQAQALDESERGQRWIIDNVEVSGSHGVGIRTGDSTTVRGVSVHHNGQLGISVSGGTDVVVEDSEIAFNNIAGFDWNWEGGGLKATRTAGLIVRNNHSHHNDGPGLWTDIDAMDTLYDGNIVLDNTAAGIFHEISGPAVIRGNTIERNGFGKPEWLWGGGILIAASSDVEIYDNRVIDNADGITGVQQERGDGPLGPYYLQNVFVHHNTIRMETGQTGVVDDTGSAAVFTERNIVFSSNTYVDVSGRRFAWEGRSLDRNGWLAVGQDEGAQWE